MWCLEQLGSKGSEQSILGYLSYSAPTWRSWRGKHKVLSTKTETCPLVLMSVRAQSLCAPSIGTQARQRRPYPSSSNQHEIICAKVKTLADSLRVTGITKCHWLVTPRNQLSKILEQVLGWNQTAQ